MLFSTLTVLILIKIKGAKLEIIIVHSCRFTVFLTNYILKSYKEYQSLKLKTHKYCFDSFLSAFFQYPLSNITADNISGANKYYFHSQPKKRFHDNSLYANKIRFVKNL